MYRGTVADAIDQAVLARIHAEFAVVEAVLHVQELADLVATLETR
jgi:hypothetical protein